MTDPRPSVSALKTSDRDAQDARGLLAGSVLSTDTAARIRAGDATLVTSDAALRAIRAALCFRREG